jgi:hypothetical protein
MWEIFDECKRGGIVRIDVLLLPKEQINITHLQLVSLLLLPFFLNFNSL